MLQLCASRFRGANCCSSQHSSNGNKLRPLVLARAGSACGSCCLACTQTERPAAQSLAGARYACERRLGGALVLLRTNRLLASVLRTLARLVLETSSGTLAGLRTPAQRREHSKGLLQQRSSRAAASGVTSIVYWQFGTRQPPRPQNHEHLLPLAGREPGPDQARRGEPRGEPADHDALSKTSPARGSRSSRRIRTRELAATGRARSPTEPEATHPSEQFTGIGTTEAHGREEKAAFTAGLDHAYR